MPDITGILIRQAMTKDPAQRPQTAVALARDLDRIDTLLEGVSAAPTLASQVVVENTEVPPEPSETATVSNSSSTPLPAPVPPVGSSKTYVQYIFDSNYNS